MRLPIESSRRRREGNENHWKAKKVNEINTATY